MSRTLKRHAARLLGFERLDPRLCLAVEAVLDGGLLTITGTPEDDTIVVRDNREGDIVVETRDPDNRFEPFEGVERIVINTLAGDDTVRYHVRHSASIPAEFNLGDGEDELSAHVSFARGTRRTKPPISISIQAPGTTTWTLPTLRSAAIWS